MKKKFRIYDRKNKQMLFFTTPSKRDNIEYSKGVLSIGDVKHELQDLSEPMLFTGLVDKNQNAIWEDDYIMTEHGVMIVYFIGGRFILMWADNGTFYEELYDLHSSIVVSGNKHEHKISNSQKIIKNKKS